MTRFTASTNRYGVILDRCPGLNGEYQCMLQGITPGGRGGMEDGGWHDINSVARNGRSSLPLFFGLISLYC